MCGNRFQAAVFFKRNGNERGVFIHKAFGNRLNRFTNHDVLKATQRRIVDIGAICGFVIKSIEKIATKSRMLNGCHTLADSDSFKAGGIKALMRKGLDRIGDVDAFKILTFHKTPKRDLGYLTRKVDFCQRGRESRREI